MAFTRTLLALTMATLLSPSLLAQVTLPTTKVAAEKDHSNLENTKTLGISDIDAELISNINDTVRYTPGVAGNNTGNRFGDNGFNIRGMEGDAVAITVDGLSQGETLNPLTYSRYGMYSSTRNGVEIDSVKSVEIVKGANSILAGNGALGGAVMYTTKDASDFLPSTGDATAGNIKTAYDNRNEETAATLALANRSGNLESLVIYTIRDGSETKAHSDGADITGAGRGQADTFNNDKNNVLIKLAYQFNPQHRLAFVYEDYNSKNSGTPLSRDSSSYYDFNTVDESNRQRTGLNYSWQANNALFDLLDIKLNQQEIYTTGVTAFSYGSGDAAYLRIEDRNYTQKLVNLTADFTKIIRSQGLSHDLVYGFSGQSGEVENNLQDIRYNGLTRDTGLRSGYPIIDPSWVPKTETDTWTLYFRDLIEVTDQLTLVAGLRYDNTRYSPQINDTFADDAQTVDDAEFSALSGQLSARYEFIPGHSVIASVGSGFKAPTTEQLYLNTNQTSQYTDTNRVVDPITGSISYVSTGLTENDIDTKTNPDLEAEEGINYELTYAWLGKFASLKLSAFRSDYHNMILNINHSTDFATAINQASLNSRDPACQTAILTDACWTVTQVLADDYSVPTNTGKISVNGIELIADWLINEQLTATIAYSHTKGEYKNSPQGVTSDVVVGSYQKGNALESISPDDLVLGLYYHSQDNTWGAATMAKFIDGKDLDESFSATYYSNSAQLLDVSAWYNITDNLTVRANITNLFDENYSLWNRVRNVRAGSGGFFGGVTGDGIDRYSEPGRQFSAQVSYSF
ncbi:TonB-dependent hemoglobin/transferrin/lactoferrin family receptor [Paraglaciecola sp.]|uniref:TonB-dependent hemoglobin/transferrin/lactoferrin family receptor n=1 Tax=Paraglaciecola sp. TaxID=1920173 RepID=UPI0030F3FB31